MLKKVGVRGSERDFPSIHQIYFTTPSLAFLLAGTHVAPEVSIIYVTCTAALTKMQSCLRLDEKRSQANAGIWGSDHVSGAALLRPGGGCGLLDHSA